LVSHPSSRELANIIVFTEDRASRDIMNEILSRVEVTANTSVLSRLRRLREWNV